MRSVLPRHCCPRSGSEVASPSSERPLTVPMSMVSDIWSRDQRTGLAYIAVIGILLGRYALTGQMRISPKDLSGFVSVFRA